MQNTMRAQVLGMRRFDINGTKMASLYITQPFEEGQEDVAGLEVMKASCPYNMLDQLQKVTLPGEFDVAFKMKTAAGGKVGIVVSSVREVTGSALNSQDKKRS